MGLLFLSLSYISFLSLSFSYHLFSSLLCGSSEKAGRCKVSLLSFLYFPFLIPLVLVFSPTLISFSCLSHLSLSSLFSSLSRAHLHPLSLSHLCRFYILHCRTWIPSSKKEMMHFQDEVSSQVISDFKSLLEFCRPIAVT